MDDFSTGTQIHSPFIQSKIKTVSAYDEPGFSYITSE